MLFNVCMFFSPLEQYKILYVITGVQTSGIFDFSITFITIILFINVMILHGVFLLNPSKKIINTSYFYSFESLFVFVYSLIKNILPKSGLQMFVPIFICFYFILCSNILGLIPYSYCVTSQLVITSSLSFTIFFFLIYSGIKANGFKLSSMFLPENTSFLLSFLIVPIEIISFIFRPISLSVRLFSNMMAGHALLKVIVSFVWKLIIIGSFLQFILVILLVLLFFLEFCVACIQAYVFTMLFVIYTNDMISSH